MILLVQTNIEILVFRKIVGRAQVHAAVASVRTFRATLGGNTQHAATFADREDASSLSSRVLSSGWEQIWPDKLANVGPLQSGIIPHVSVILPQAFSLSESNLSSIRWGGCRLRFLYPISRPVHKCCSHRSTQVVESLTSASAYRFFNDRVYHVNYKINLSDVCVSIQIAHSHQDLKTAGTTCFGQVLFLGVCLSSRARAGDLRESYSWFGRHSLYKWCSREIKLQSWSKIVRLFLVWSRFK